MAYKAHKTDLLTVALDFNGSTKLSDILAEMQSRFEDVADVYVGKTNKAELDIRAALKAANEVIYREVKMKAPRIKPHIQATKSKDRKDIHLKDHIQAKATNGKTWRSQGMSRVVVTFAPIVGSYAAALEYGRDEFMQVMKKKPFGIKGGDTDYWLRSVGAAKAQPFIRDAQTRKAQAAFDTFSSVLGTRWVKRMKAVEKKIAAKAKKGD